jgi:hypothetical protein
LVIKEWAAHIVFSWTSGWINISALFLFVQPDTQEAQTSNASLDEPAWG